MYIKGDLKSIEPPCDKMEKEGACYEYHEDFTPHVHMLNDSRHGLNWKASSVYLPHSCQEWLIGGPDQVRELISDLQEALKGMG